MCISYLSIKILVHVHDVQLFVLVHFYMFTLGLQRIVVLLYPDIRLV